MFHLESPRPRNEIVKMTMELGERGAVYNALRHLKFKWDAAHERRTGNIRTPNKIFISSEKRSKKNDYSVFGVVVAFYLLQTNQWKWLQSNAFTYAM